MTDKRYVLKSDGFLLQTVVDTFEDIEMSAEGVVNDLNELSEENEQLKKCNKQLARRSISLDGICNPNCQMARKETVGHGDIRWICIINRSGDGTCHFGEVCKFLEGLEPIEDITDCVW